MISLDYMCLYSFTCVYIISCAVYYAVILCGYFMLYALKIGLLFVIIAGELDITSFRPVIYNGYWIGVLFYSSYYTIIVGADVWILRYYSLLISDFGLNVELTDGLF